MISDLKGQVFSPPVVFMMTKKQNKLLYLYELTQSVNQD